MGKDMHDTIVEVQSLIRRWNAAREYNLLRTHMISIFSFTPLCLVSCQLELHTMKPVLFLSNLPLHLSNEQVPRKLPRRVL